MPSRILGLYLYPHFKHLMHLVFFFPLGFVYLLVFNFSQERQFFPCRCRVVQATFVSKLLSVSNNWSFTCKKELSTSTRRCCCRPF